MHIAIAGNIAAGKSTLTRLLCQELGCEPAYEPVAENPFLSSFYQRDARWSFHTQTTFLSLRAAQHLQIQTRDDLVIQDRSIYEDAEVFAWAQHELGYMSADEYATYRRLYAVLAALLEPPSLLVHLYAPVETLRQRLDRRARAIEATVTDAYLGQLNGAYRRWADSFGLCPVLEVRADCLDIDDHAALAALAAQIRTVAC
ncbi:MAG: deoxynucleoside kinase [Chloroflexi bacterium]|jgi:deoxyadenosine/deoxycytidine kinase|nr:deoxynucleoside kinase [Chloroflexota bacterium]